MQIKAPITIEKRRGIGIVSAQPGGSSVSGGGGGAGGNGAPGIAIIVTYF